MAGRIREDDIAEVREKARIDEVVSGYVTLRNAGGGSMKGLCPFHDEKSPSFHVTPARGFYHCFGCQEGGDVIAFLMKIDGLAFTETVERLADRFGVTLRREEGDVRDDRPRGPQRRRLVEANKVAQEFYAEQLASPEAVAGRQFLGERGFDQAAAETFGVGFAPRDGEALVRHLRQRGSATRRRSRPDSWRWAVRPTTGSAAGCCGRSATPAATRSASARAGSSTTTRSRPSTSTPPRRRSTRRARCSTASTWPAATWPACPRPWSSRATPT